MMRASMPCRRVARAAVLVFVLLSVIVAGAPARGRGEAATSGHARLGRTQTPRHPSALHPGPLDFQPGKVMRDTLGCGISVFLRPNHDLPLLDVVLGVKLGQSWLPMDRHAALDLLLACWRTGGTESIPPDSLDAILAALDARMSTPSGPRTTLVAISGSSEDSDSLLHLLHDVVLHPAFNADRLARAQANCVKGLQGINNDPSEIASMRWGQLVYGQDHPSGHFRTREEIEAVRREDLIALHRRFVLPRNTAIGVSGDFEPGRIMAQLDSLFRDWPVPGAYEPPELHAWVPRPRPGLYLLRGDYAQARVTLGRIVPAPTRDSPDAPAARILEFAFGYMRVFYRTREEGLSFGTGVFLDLKEDHAVLSAGGSCRNEAAVRLTKTVLDEMDALEQRPITREEMETSRTFRIGGRVEDAEAASWVVQRQVELALQGQALDHDQVELERFKGVTLADLARLAPVCMKTDSLVVLIVGDPAKFEMPTDSLRLGRMTELAPIEFGK